MTTTTSAVWPVPTTKFHLHPLVSAIVSPHLYLQVSYCISKVTHRHAPTLSNVTVTNPSHCDHKQWWQYHHPTTSTLLPPLLTSQVCMFTHSPTLTHQPPYSTTACTWWQCLRCDSTHRYVGSPHISVTLTSYWPTCTHCGLLQQQQRWQWQWLSPMRANTTWWQQINNNTTITPTTMWTTTPTQHTTISITTATASIPPPPLSRVNHHHATPCTHTRSMTMTMVSAPYPLASTTNVNHQWRCGIYGLPVTTPWPHRTPYPSRSSSTVFQSPCYSSAALYSPLLCGALYSSIYSNYVPLCLQLLFPSIPVCYPLPLFLL